MNAHAQPKAAAAAETVCVAADDLRRSLAFVRKVIERRNTIPVLNMIRLDAQGKALTLRGTDLDIECEVELEASANGQLSCLLMPGLLADLVRYAEGPVTIGKEGEIVTISADDVTAEVRALCPPEDWPDFMDKRDLGAPATIGEGALHKALSTTLPCVSTEETRYYLNGVYLHDAGEGLVAVATDGHRLARYETGEDWGLDGAILPRKTARAVLDRLRADGNGSVSVRPASSKRSGRLPVGFGAPKPATDESSTFLSHLVFEGQGWAVRSKIIDGTFPNYSRVIPKRTGKISATVTAAALKRFPRGSERTRALQIDPDGGRMTMKGVLENATISMPIQGTGPAMGCNLNYLLGFAQRAGTIRIEGNSPNDPFHILTDDPRLTQILMPMRV
ncbi:DNA polymerase III subunit beta [Limimaricola variabilis]